MPHMRRGRHLPSIVRRSNIRCRLLRTMTRRPAAPRRIATHWQRRRTCQHMIGTVALGRRSSSRSFLGGTRFVSSTRRNCFGRIRWLDSSTLDPGCRPQSQKTRNLGRSRRPYRTGSRCHQARSSRPMRSSHWGTCWRHSQRPPRGSKGLSVHPKPSGRRTLRRSARDRRQPPNKRREKRLIGTMSHSSFGPDPGPRGRPAALPATVNTRPFGSKRSAIP